MGIDLKPGWAKRHPLQYGASFGLFFGFGSLLVFLVRGHSIASSVVLAVAVGAGGLLLGTLGGYMARRMYPD